MDNNRQDPETLRRRIALFHAFIQEEILSTAWKEIYVRQLERDMAVLSMMEETPKGRRKRLRSG